MRTADVIKLALAVCALVLLVWGIRADNETVRWAAIVCLAIAVAIRFIAPRRPLN